MPETEDHIACLFEVMRYLIAGDDVAVANLTQQQRILQPRTCSPGCRPCAMQYPQHPKARFYAALAALHPRLRRVEAQGFDMLSVSESSVECQCPR